MSTYKARKIRKAAETLHEKKPLSERYYPDYIIEEDYDTGKPSVSMKVYDHCVDFPVDRFKYYACKLHDIEGDDFISMFPEKISSSIADSRVPFNDYRYTHGGTTYVKAVDYAKDIMEEIENLSKK